MNNLDLILFKPSRLEKAFSLFKGQQLRVVKGIHDNPGILTHEVCGNFYCNNVPDIAQCSNERLSVYGLKLVCIPQDKPNKLTKSHRWYLTVLDVGKAANDEVLL